MKKTRAVLLRRLYCTAKKLPKPWLIYVTNFTQMQYEDALFYKLVRKKQN